MIELDLTFIFTNFIPWLNEFANQLLIDFSNPDPMVSVYLFLFKYQGWLLYVYIVFRYLLYPEYMLYIQNRWFAKNVQMILLAVDVPRMNEQSIQAMENFFDHLLGAHGTFTWWAKYIEGEFQLSFSCELVSIDGNIQFLIRTPKHLRNLVEAALYGQYPDAEITEVEDYTPSVPRYFPNETHDIWGTEFTLSNKNVYLPIKTYDKFEHRFTEVFADPMAALLETMSEIGPGEQIWIQYLIKPLEVAWGREGGAKEINKIIGKKEKPPTNFIGQAFDRLLEVVSLFTEQTIGGSFVATEEKKPESKDEQFKMMNLTPGQKEQLEAMEKKIARLGYGVKIRFIYIAEKGKMNKAIGVNGIIGSIKQWTDMNANGLKPALKETGTNAPQYIMIEKRRNRRRNFLMGAYRKRDGQMGMAFKPMCTPELASLWHFPGINIKAPFLKATAFKKAAEPVGLPMEDKLPVVAEPRKLEEVIEEKSRVMPTFDYDNDEFEKQFAIDKEEFAKTRPMREKKLQEIAVAEEKKAKEAAAAEVAKVNEAKKIAGAAAVKTDKPVAKAGKAPVANLLQQAEIEEKKEKLEQNAEPKAEKEKSGVTPGNLPFLD